MKASNKAVLAGLNRIRETFNTLLDDNGYCTSETERFELVLDRLIRCVAEDKDIEEDQ